ncbi:serine hydrolase domain-containing protein [Anaerorhabdus sp.]|uniref:serine hydrolase domain-containing protein n=1 Tax=Anaerorhabdus sp. TaxID=1872524 RepID=UPI002FC8D2AE
MIQNLDELRGLIQKDYDNTAGIIIKKKDKVIYEEYFDESNQDTASHLFSMTKSIVSICIGIAIDQGYIKSVDDKVLDYFPEYEVKKGEKTIQQITIRHLLTMTAPYKYIFAPYTKHFSNTDWVKSALDYLGGKKPIGNFRYTPIVGPDILTGILTKVTGKSVLDYARENLFNPLDIHVEKSIVFKDKESQMTYYKTKTISVWVSDEMGVNTCGWGLSLSARDLVKIAELYLNHGQYHNQQIVSAEWVRQSTSKQSTWKSKNLDYGYLWWLVKDGYAALGDGGNVVYVNKKENMIVVITGYFKPRCKDRLDLIEQVIVPLSNK